MAGREGRRKPVPRQSSFRSVAAMMLIPLCAFVVFVFYKFVRDHVDDSRATHSSMVTRLPLSRATMATRQPGNPATAPSGNPATRSRGNIDLIIDDDGFDHQPLDAAMRIAPILNFSILSHA